MLQPGGDSDSREGKRGCSRGWGPWQNLAVCRGTPALGTPALGTPALALSPPFLNAGSGAGEIPVRERSCLVRSQGESRGMWNRECRWRMSTGEFERASPLVCRWRREISRSRWHKTSLIWVNGFYFLGFRLPQLLQGRKGKQDATVFLDVYFVSKEQLVFQRLHSSHCSFRGRASSRAVSEPISDAAAVFPRGAWDWAQFPYLHLVLCSHPGSDGKKLLISPLGTRISDCAWYTAIGNRASAGLHVTGERH